MKANRVRVRTPPKKCSAQVTAITRASVGSTTDSHHSPATGRARRNAAMPTVRSIGQRVKARPPQVEPAIENSMPQVPTQRPISGPW